MIPLHDDNPTERPPIITIAWIVACALVFLYQASLPAGPGETFVFQYGAIPALVFGEADPPEMGVAIPAYATLITSMFLHGGWMHLIGNMLYLWVFGNNIEDAMGHAKYIAFYLTCGILAALSHALTDPSSSIPMVGASGAKDTRARGGMAVLRMTMVAEPGASHWRERSRVDEGRQHAPPTRKFRPSIASLGFTRHARTRQSPETTRMWRSARARVVSLTHSWRQFPCVHASDSLERPSC